MSLLAASEVKPSGWLRVWLIFGGLVVTAAGSAAYWFGAFVWELVQNPARGIYAFGPFLLVWIPLTVINFAIASTAQIFAYPFLVAYACLLIYFSGRVSFPLLLAISPLLGLLAWYGYDHLVPDFRWYTDERPPYVHGLTLERFMLAWLFEIAMVLGYWWPLRRLRLAQRVPA